VADNALDVIPDPLVTPVLALLYDAINADLAIDMAAAGVPVENAVSTTSHVPFTLTMVGAGALPALHCYRVRSRSSQQTVQWVNHTSTLQFVYATPAAGREQLDVRWPLLDRVWHSMLRALKRGYHPAHAGGDLVLLEAGVVRIDLSTAIKREAFIEAGQQTFPGFVAELDVVWRDANDIDQGPFFPALSFDALLFTDRPVDTETEADVHARAVLPAGVPPGKDFPPPDDWSLKP
jgi:hypothetical protein